MNRKVLSFFLTVLSVLALTAIGQAQTTYEDPQGRFAIDLPKGWQLAPQTDDKVFVFQGEGKSIIIECIPMVGDPAELLKKAENTVRLTGMAKPALDGQITEMTVNGLPARWGVYKGVMAGVTLAALCGSVAIGENGLYYLSFIPVAQVATWKDRLEGTFRTIRGSGQKVTGVENVKTVGGAMEPAPPAAATPWSCDLVSLSLPAGWAEKPKPRGFEKEVKGWFMSEALPGTSLMVVCYKGMGMNLVKAFDAGIKTITIPNPGLKPVEAQEIGLPSGKANFAAYKGMVAAGGQEVELASVIISCKADKSYTNLILTGLGHLLPELKSQALEIARTVK
jgi:hypothetical protein